MATNSLVLGILPAANIPTAGMLRAGYTGEQSVSDAQGRYFEPTRLGSVYWLNSGSVTIAAANATGQALGTIKFINGMFNPPNSGKLLSILHTRVTTVSGTPAGPFFYSYIVPGAIVSSAATGTIRNGYLNNSTTSAATPLVNVALATLAANTTTVDTAIGVVGGPTAVAATGACIDAADETAGSIVVPPGVLFGITATGAGTTHVVQSTIRWQEITL